MTTDLRLRLDRARRLAAEHRAAGNTAEAGLYSTIAGRLQAELQARRSVAAPRRTLPPSRRIRGWRAPP
jgi:hypothetical protein